MNSSLASAGPVAKAKAICDSLGPGPERGLNQKLALAITATYMGVSLLNPLFQGTHPHRSSSRALVSGVGGVTVPAAAAAAVEFMMNHPDSHNESSG